VTDYRRLMLQEYEYIRKELPEFKEIFMRGNMHCCNVYTTVIDAAISCETRLGDHAMLPQNIAMSLGKIEEYLREMRRKLQDKFHLHYVENHFETRREDEEKTGKRSEAVPPNFRECDTWRKFAKRCDQSPMSGMCRICPSRDNLMS